MIHSVTMVSFAYNGFVFRPPTLMRRPWPTAAGGMTCSTACGRVLARRRGNFTMLSDLEDKRGSTIVSTLPPQPPRITKGGSNNTDNHRIGILDSGWLNCLAINNNSLRANHLARALKFAGPPPSERIPPCVSTNPDTYGQRGVQLQRIWAV